MILTKYMFKEIFRNQLIILVVLLLVCICQKLIKSFGLGNSIPIYLIFLYLVLSIPELSKLIIPFSLFLSVAITCYRLHIHNEILAMYSCAVKKSFFIRKILLYSSIVFCITFINVTWLSPYCEQYRNNILFDIKNHINLNELIVKKFQFLFDKKLVLFVDNINDKVLQNIFIFNKKDIKNNTFRVITAKQSQVRANSNCIQSMILNAGTYYDIHYDPIMYPNVCVTNFSQYQILMDYDFKSLTPRYNTISSMSMVKLWNVSTIEAKIEFNWRLILLISIFIMPLIALLLMINISYNHLPNFLLAIVLYAFFFLSHILLRSYAILDYSFATICMWLFNCIYCVTTVLINMRIVFRLKVFLKKFLYFL